jgi:hypothetical protein
VGQNKPIHCGSSKAKRNRAIVFTLLLQICDSLRLSAQLRPDEDRKMPDKLGVAACTCIATVWYIDYTMFHGAYFDTLVRLMSDLYSRIS